MTFKSRRPRHRSARSIAFLLLTGLCGCTVAPPAFADADRSSEGTVSPGVIVSVRPVTAAPADTRRSILGAMGAAAAEPRGSMAEIIVREDDGRTVSLMQTGAGNFRAGERILLTRGAGARIARP
jgi:outer membrane lipoprotein SlyB